LAAEKRFRGNASLRQIAKDLDSGSSHSVAYWVHPTIGKSSGRQIMAEKTCAACDCKLNEDVIKVKIGGKTVEVCCDDCAKKLKEASSSSREG
jgi:hypothetical protein